MVAVSTPARPYTVTLDAVLERVTYVNEETGYTIARVATDRGSDLLTVVGALLGAQPGESLRLVGRWSSHPRFGRQFEVGVGVSTSLAVRIYKQYGDASIALVKNEPYRLASDVWGIGFKTADTIAKAVGIPHDSPARVKAGLQYTLSQAADAGHCYLPQPDLIGDAAKILGVPTDLIGGCLDEFGRRGGRGPRGAARPRP
jgi:Helix-hairpin-helix containing domain